MLPVNSTSSHAHNEATKTQCAICVTEIGHQSSKDSRQMYKLCSKYLHPGIAKEIPDDCELEETFSDKDQIPLCGKCLGSAKELEGLTQTLASLRKRVADMVLIFSLEILHRRGRNSRNEEGLMKLIQMDVSKLPDNDSWSFPTFITTTDEIASTALQENIDYAGCMDKGDNVELMEYDLDFKGADIVEIELITEVEQAPVGIEGPLKNTPCATAEFISPQENISCVTEIGNTLEISECDKNECFIRTTTGGKDQKASTETNASEISVEDVVIEENIDLTSCKDGQPKTITERNDKYMQNRISMPSVKLQRLHFQCKPNLNGQDTILVNGERKSNTVPKFELIVKRESAISTENIPEVLQRVQNLSVPSTSTSSFSVPMLATNSTTVCNSVDMKRIPKKTPLKKNVELARDSGQKDNYQSQKSKSKHSGDSDKRNSKKGGFPCPLCKKIFLQRSRLLIHRRQHKSSLCPQRNKLRKHLRVKHVDKISKCSFCEKEFSHRGHLNEHLRTHTGEKPFNCTSCKMSFAHNSTLKKHIRIHTGEKPYKCDKCDYSSAQSSTLISHKIRRHSNKV